MYMGIHATRGRERFRSNGSNSRGIDLALMLQKSRVGLPAIDRAQRRPPALYRRTAAQSHIKSDLI